jgi:hypothetical protein
LLGPPSLLRFPFLLKGKLVARKQGRCAEKASAGKEIHSEIPPYFRRMGRAQRVPSGSTELAEVRAPLHWNTPVLRERTACPPGPRKGGVPHGFCTQRPCFRAGQCLKFNRSCVVHITLYGFIYFFILFLSISIPRPGPLGTMLNSGATGVSARIDHSGPVAASTASPR